MRITKKQFYLVEGLLSAAQKKYAEAHELIGMIAAELKQEPDDPTDASPYYGHVSDALYSTFTSKELLSKLKITVRK